MDAFRKKFGIGNGVNGQPQQRSSSSSSEEGNNGFNKAKMMSMWHNMKYSKTFFAIDSNASFSSNSAVWLLGQCYHKRLSETERFHQMQGNDSGMEGFLEDFSSRAWFTYRKDFEEFKNSRLVTDTGWGCMIRSGQMILANALICQKLGRHWRWRTRTRQVLTVDDVEEELMHRKIIRMFGDTNDEAVSPLSIHQIMAVAQEAFGKNPGSWFGPSTTAHLLQKAVSKFQHHELLRNLKVYVANDSTVYKQDIKDMCAGARRRRSEYRKSGSVDSLINFDEYSILDPNEILVPQLDPNQFYTDRHSIPHFLPDSSATTEPHNIRVENENFQKSSATSPTSPTGPGGLTVPSRRHPGRSSSFPKGVLDDWTPVLILIPMRLGRDDKLNPIYAPCLRSMLASENCLGIIGGKPKHSMFFMGFQDDGLIYLDPHLAQDRVDVFNPDFSLDTYHCHSPRKLNMSRMDPSCCIGFLIESEMQLEGWCELAKELIVPPGKMQPLQYPMFTITDGRSSDHIPVMDADEEVLSSIAQLDSIDESAIDANLVIPPSIEDEYVFL